MSTIMQSIDKFLISIPHGYIIGFLLLVIALYIVGNYRLIRDTVRQIKTEIKRGDREATDNDNQINFQIDDNKGRIKELGREIRKEIREGEKGINGRYMDKESRQDNIS